MPKREDAIVLDLRAQAVHGLAARQIMDSITDSPTREALDLHMGAVISGSNRVCAALEGVLAVLNDGGPLCHNRIYNAIGAGLKENR